jgi:8-oxo-dGTP pyrophosphatase MutT (NUDIX family)
MMIFYQWLEHRCQLPLPGREAHRRFVPNVPDAHKRLANAPTDAKQSAVLIPLVADEFDELGVLFTVRSESLRSHKGQISFPGGRLDLNETHVEAALREAHEEIGISASDIHVLGTLSPLYIPPSNSAVTPIIAAIQRQASWNLSTAEVAEVVIRPLSDFLNDSLFEERAGIIPHLPINVPMWDVHPTIPLWGATAMMLNEVVMLYNEFLLEGS